MKTFDPAVVGRRVREEREKAGMSLSQLAAGSGLTKAYLVRLENQGGNPTLDALMGIADALELTVADLVDRPRLSFDLSEAPPPPSLLAYADEFGLTSAEVRMLASIQFRRGERPRSSERWKYIHDSLRASREFDRDDGDDSD
ncbi:MAG TPA: helix-turn-helix transcriptional regulator [Thermoleophilaceae bacterium]